MKKFDYDVFYNALIVSPPGWTDFVNSSDANWRQGFSWTPAGVIFMFSDVDDAVEIEAGVVQDHPSVEEAALRAIEVPFVAGPVTQISTVGIHGVVLDIPPGEYSLRFVLLPGFARGDQTYSYSARLTFVPRTDAEYAILRTGHREMTSDVIIERVTPVNRKRSR